MPEPPHRFRRPRPVYPDEMAGKPAEPSACGPLTITRLAKDDGRALIVYACKTDSDAK
jgi:hypothetical protein